MSDVSERGEETYDAKTSLVPVVAAVAGNTCPIQVEQVARRCQASSEGYMAYLSAYMLAPLRVVTST